MAKPFINLSMLRPRFIGWLLVLITLLAFLPMLRNGFINFDDNDYVTENPMVQKGTTIQGFEWAFTTWHASNWHPLTWLSHMVDCEIFRLNPAGHHLVNLLFHAANACLLFILWWRLTDARWPSAMVAALFAWHPLHVESVAWVSERKDVLSTFFALLTLLNYAHWARGISGAGISSAALPVSRYYWAAVLFFALGLMCKPMLVTLPLVMVLLDFWPLRRGQRAHPDTTPQSRGSRLVQLLWEKWPFLILTVLSCIVTVLAQKAEAMAPLTKYPMGLRLENVIVAYAEYLYKTVWPMNLAVFYPLAQPGRLAVMLAAAVLLAVSALVCWRAKPQPYLITGWLWFLGTLVPVIGLLQVGDQAMADRYTYFPLIGLFVAGAWTAKDCAQYFHLSDRWLTATALVVLAACLALTERQLRFWHNSETLFTHALNVTQDNATARLNLGEAYQEQHRTDNALAEYRQALKLDPASFEVYNNLGRLLNDQDKPAEALDYCRKAVALNPKSAQSHTGLGIVLAELGHFNEAMEQFAESIRLNGSSAAPHFQMGRVLLKVGRDAEAVTQFQEALRLEPNNFGMLIFIARVRASDSNPEGRDGAEALTLAEKAAQLGGAQQPVVLDTLAMACAESGHFDEAVNLARQAANAALTAGSNEDVTNMQQRLEHYQKHEPARISFRIP